MLLLLRELLLLQFQLCLLGKLLLLLLDYRSELLLLAHSGKLLHELLLMLREQDMLARGNRLALSGRLLL